MSFWKTCQRRICHRKSTSPSSKSSGVAKGRAACGTVQKNSVVGHPFRLWEGTAYHGPKKCDFDTLQPPFFLVTFVKSGQENLSVFPVSFTPLSGAILQRGCSLYRRLWHSKNTI
mmetsp:Transcript_34602/g.55297  ORF Transcript_34602/g.55297 Transcript_34602/m.55297 type:complete len:115 (-) Transcript_34602:1282-1626(-)